MAYMCKTNNRECDACGKCTPTQPPETGVVVEATIKLKFSVYGKLERLLRSGEKEKAQEYAEQLVDFTIDCCGLVSEDMTVDEVAIELNE